MTEAELDARFAEMADDAEYQADAIALAAEFELSDWEAFQCTESLDSEADTIRGSGDDSARHQ